MPPRSPALVSVFNGLMAAHTHDPHTHDRHTHDDIDWSERLAMLRMADALDADALAPVAERLVAALPAGARVVDVGCGAGGMSGHLARALARRGGGRLVLVDATPVLLGEAERVVTEAAGGQVEVEAVVADLADVEAVARLGFSDLVWASRVVHHLPDQQAAVRGLASVVRSGGTLALAEGGLEMQCLPWDLGVGRPGLEQRLLAARGDWFVAMRAGIPGAVPMPYGWPVALRRAGLADIGSFGVLIDHPAPGSALLREYVVDRLLRLAGFAEHDSGAGLDADDRAAVAALTDPQSPEYVGARDDLFLLGAKTIHCGRRV